MAKSNRATQNDNTEASEDDNTEEPKRIPQAPKDFTLNVGRDRGDGWAMKVEGNEIEGRLVGRASYRDKSTGKERSFYQIKLHRPCAAVIPEDPENPDSDTVEGELPKDAIVNVDETAKLSDLAPYTKDGGVYNVWMAYGEKQNLGGGRTMWQVFGPKLQVVRKPEELPR